MFLKLKRIALTEFGTFGVLLHEDIPFAVTMERPWLDNRVGESCIPQGEYTCLRCNRSPDYGFRNSPKFGDTFQVYDVPGRSKILFHKGNLADDSHGCILVGEQFGVLTEVPAVLASKHGFEEFLLLLKDQDDFVLNITEH